MSLYPLIKSGFSLSTWDFSIKDIFFFDSDRYEVVFGKNRKHEIGQYIKNGDMNKESLSSYRVINEGFKKGKWFIITDRDTTDEFKKDYIKKKEDFAKKEKDMLYRDLLLSALEQMEDLSENQKRAFEEEETNCSYERLEELITALMSSFSKSNKDTI